MVVAVRGEVGAEYRTAGRDERRATMTTATMPIRSQSFAASGVAILLARRGH